MKKRLIALLTVFALLISFTFAAVSANAEYSASVIAKTPTAQGGTVTALSSDVLKEVTDASNSNISELNIDGLSDAIKAYNQSTGDSKNYTSYCYTVAKAFDLTGTPGVPITVSDAGTYKICPIVAHEVDGNWVAVGTDKSSSEYAVLNEDGTIEIVLQHFCPVIFLTLDESRAASFNGCPFCSWLNCDDTCNCWIIYAVIALLIVAVIVLLVLLLKKNKKNNNTPVAPQEENKPAEAPQEENKEEVKEAEEATESEEEAPAEEAQEEQPAEDSKEEAPAEETQEEQPAEEANEEPAEENEEAESEGENEEAESEEEAAPAQGQATETYYAISYNKSFTAKLVESEDAVKGYYSTVKNELAKYGSSSVMSWKCESFRVGRAFPVKVLVKGKALCVYLAIDPAELEGTKYRVKNCGEKGSFKSTPSLLKVNSPRKEKYAKDLIAMLMAKLNKEAQEVETVDYAAELKAMTDDELIEKGLMKVKVKTISEQNDRAHTVQRYTVITKEELAEAMSDRDASYMISSTGNAADESVKATVTLDALKEAFEAGAEINLAAVKEKGLASADATYLKIEASDSLDKAFKLVADEVNLDAAKMILLLGGSVAVNKAE